MNASVEHTICARDPLSLAIPEELLARSQWIAWWSVVGEGCRIQLPNGRLSGVIKAQAKPHKLPINPRTGGLAASTRPKTWSSAENASAAVKRWSLTGVGFVFTDSDPYTGIDIDNCRDPVSGEIADWAWNIIRTLNSYTEISPSGTGVHTIVRGKLPVGKGNQVAHGDGKVEMFSRARYFTFTGIHVDGNPIEICDRQTELIALHNQLFADRNTPKAEKHSTPSSPLLTSDDELITKARQAHNGSKFERLWNGQWEGDYPSQSEADLALCCVLAFWTRKDRARMDGLFRRSSLMRKKWLRKDYREETLLRAIECADQTWSGEAMRRNGFSNIVNSNVQTLRMSQPTSNEPWEPPIPIRRFHLPSFPTEALPDWLRVFVEAEARATQTPADLAGMLALSVIAAACAKKVEVRLKEGHVEPLNLFTVTALPSGSRKTAVFTAMMRPLTEYERSESLRLSGDIVRTQTARNIKEAKLKRLQEQAVNAAGKDQNKLTEEAATLAAELTGMRLTVATRLIADDCTPERLVMLLRDQGGRIAVMSPEGDVFDLLAGRYSTNGLANFGVFLRGHAGDTLRVDRVGRPSEFVEAPALTVGLAVQPEVVRGLAQKPGFRGRGLLARFLYALPMSLLGRRDTNAQPVPDDVSSDYRSNVLALLNIPFEKDRDGELNARLLSFEAWVEPMLSEFGELGGISDWAGKLVGTVGRIAANLHMAALAGSASPWDIPIAIETIENAISFGKYLIPHAKAAFAEMGADAVVLHAKAILRWLDHKRVSSFTKREVHQAMKTKLKKAEELDNPLDLLSVHGFIRLRPDNSSVGPGRPPSPTYDVNPLWDRDRQGVTAGAANLNFEDSEYFEKA